MLVCVWAGVPDKTAGDTIILHPALCAQNQTRVHTPLPPTCPRPPVAGDIIIFHPTEGVGRKSFLGDDVFIKRVVAVEGDTVEVCRGLLLFCHVFLCVAEGGTIAFIKRVAAVEGDTVEVSRQGLVSCRSL